ncbi:DUF6286 domain-containing protein [Gordonia sp. CPCC 205515]|uniref:DUF6286 domain-containing protein n=1 Tax=Gordonia sp. CPCC 205515 TaxID=3140791 RepID=UPI003AF3FB69
MTAETQRPGETRSATQKTTDLSNEKVFAPAAMPAATWPGLVIGIALLAVAVIAIRDLLIDVGWLSGSQWIAAALDWIADIGWADWMWPVAVVAILLGLFLLWLAIKPRKQTHLSMSGYQVMWTRPVDLARRCSAAVSRVPEVNHASTVVGRRTVKVSVNAEPGVDPAEVTRAVDEVVSAVDAKFNTRVKYAHAPTGGDRR